MKAKDFGSYMKKNLKTIAVILTILSLFGGAFIGYGTLQADNKHNKEEIEEVKDREIHWISATGPVHLR